MGVRLRRALGSRNAHIYEFVWNPGDPGRLLADSIDRLDKIGRGGGEEKRRGMRLTCHLEPEDIKWAQASIRRESRGVLGVLVILTFWVRRPKQ